MKKHLGLLMLLVTVLVSSCSDDDDDLVGNWIRRSDFEGPARSDASCFVLNNSAYVVGGFYDGKKRLTDIWEYNLNQGYWTQKADFPGTARSSATAFASDSKGYYGTGYDGERYYNDFWEFDPDANSWTQKADFKGTARYGATAFYLNGAGYMGTGYDGNYLMDFYKYNTQADTWENSISIQGTKRSFASNFIINNKAYVVGGLNNGDYVKDFWAFDPDNQTWIEKAQIADKTDYSFDDDYSTIARLNAVALVIDGMGYFTTGETGGLNTHTWEYDPDTDRWEERTGFEGSARTAAVGFTINNRGFVLTGRSLSSLYFDDMWEFKPRDEYNEYD